MSIVGAMVTFVILILVLYLCGWLFEKFVLPLIPPKWGKWVGAILAIIVIIWLLERFFGLRL